MIGDDREEVLVEAQHLGVIQVAIDAPAAAAAQRRLDGLQKQTETRLQLLRHQAHLRVGQTVDRWPHDEAVAARSEHHQREQHQQRAADDQAVGETRLAQRI